MAQSEWKLRILPSDKAPFKYQVRLLPSPAPALAREVAAAYLYGEGDLAVYLEDRGAQRPAIEALLESESLILDRTAEIPIASFGPGIRA